MLDKQKTNNFGVKDYVYWVNDCGKPTHYGIITEIEGNSMDIQIPCKVKCQISTSAKKIHGEWLVHRPYQGYKASLFPIEDFKKFLAKYYPNYKK